MSMAEDRKVDPTGIGANATASASAELVRVPRLACRQVFQRARGFPASASFSAALVLVHAPDVSASGDRYTVFRAAD